MTLVRDALPSDAEAIARMHVDGARARYGGIVPSEPTTTAAYENGTRRWHAAISSRAETKRHILVAVKDDEVVGFAGAGPARDSDPSYRAELYALYVDAAHQRAGAGRTLFDAVAARLRADGHTRMLAWAVTASPARALYEKLGGRAVATDTLEVGGVSLEETAYAFDLG